MSRVLAEQKKSRTVLALFALCLLALLGVLPFVLRRMKVLKREKQGADAVIDEVLEQMDEAPVAQTESPDDPASPDTSGPFLSVREKEILSLIAAGLTSPQIAERLYLSLPTIKWYRKRLLSKFEAANMADLVCKAKEDGII